jgi:chromosomal replication initiation ATPase DnaA
LQSNRSKVSSMTNNSKLKGALREAIVLIDRPKRSALINILADIVSEVLNCPINDAKDFYSMSVSEIVEELSNESKMTPVDHALIMIEIIAGQCGLSSRIVREVSRKREIVEPRQISMYLIRTYFSSMSYARIGNLFGKDHATVLHAIKTVKSLRATDNGFKRKFHECMVALSEAGYLFPEDFYPNLTKQTVKHEDQQITSDVQY